jgi:hypothetical protein
MVAAPKITYLSISGLVRGKNYEKSRELNQKSNLLKKKLYFIAIRIRK